MEATEHEHDRHRLTASGNCQCDWEAQPQAFQWFPELAAAIPELPSNNPLQPPRPDVRR